MSATSTTSATSKVDSLYGPGTLLGWYLTLAGCFVSWTLNPKKRKRDSLDPDLVVSLTLPIVAVVHLISQVSKLSKSSVGSVASEQQTADAIEAPLVVIEAFMNIAAIMFILACYFIAIRRAVTVAMVGILSFAADCFVCMSNVRTTGLSRFFSRSFVADSAVALVLIGLVLALLAVTAFTITMLFFYNRHKEHQQRIRQTESEIRDLEVEMGVLVREGIAHPRWRESFSRPVLLRRPSFIESYGNLLLTCLTIVLLPSSSLTSTFSITLETNPAAESPDPTSLPVRVNPKAPGLIAFLFPKSNCSLHYLDQKVAVFAGLTALTFSLWPVLSAWYAEWNQTQIQRLQRRQEETIRLRRLILEGQSRNSGQRTGP